MKPVNLLEKSLIERIGMDKNVSQRLSKRIAQKQRILAITEDSTKNRLNHFKSHFKTGEDEKS